MEIETALCMLRALNEPVPIPAQLPSLEQIEIAEKRLGRSFPLEFRRYLIEASDVCYGVLEPVTITNPDSHTHLFKVMDHARSLGVPDELLPICHDNADFYCLNSQGEVVFWSHNGWSSEKWRSLADWIVKVWIDGG